MSSGQSGNQLILGNFHPLHSELLINCHSTKYLSTGSPLVCIKAEEATYEFVLNRTPFTN